MSDFDYRVFAACASFQGTSDSFRATLEEIGNRAGGKDKANVQRAVKRLVAMGWLLPISRGRYAIFRVVRETTKVVTGTTKVVRETTPSPDAKLSEKQQKLSEKQHGEEGIPYIRDLKDKIHIKAATDKKRPSVYAFEDFWRDYDYKKSRAKCEAKYAKISEKDRASIKAYVATYVERTNKDGRFPSRKYPHTFLNQRCWEDEMVPISEPVTKEKPPRKTRANDHQGEWNSPFDWFKDG